MVNNQEETSVSLTQDELKTIVNVFNACNIKMGDAVLMIPVMNKIIPLIKKEEPKADAPTVESINTN